MLPYFDRVPIWFELKPFLFGLAIAGLGFVVAQLSNHFTYQWLHSDERADETDATNDEDETGEP
ncbi:hypothetical protein IQ268_18675 [Oculatella sp. LEGE 06141]|uniref:hypothetical protein n=1 Tax=Oculatella sp. LEGE 06141 TaxID=1828648 RepID=UPI001882B950|nr:hypothetical protein [Oculatella sp. LEGE 06141]MBE9180590.1 hypothetical protein [Oculatella sp. LEGE 06141]